MDTSKILNGKIVTLPHLEALTFYAAENSTFPCVQVAAASVFRGVSLGLIPATPDAIEFADVHFRERMGEISSIFV